MVRGRAACELVSSRAGQRTRGGAADAAVRYQLPPKAIADLVDAPPTPSVSISIMVKSASVKATRLYMI